MNTHQPTIAAAQRQSGNADLGIRPAGNRQTEGLSCAVEFAPQDSALGLRAAGCCIDLNCLHGERSITSPSPQTAVPAQLCPPPRTATRSSCSRAKRNATTTSFLSAQNATKEGRRSIRPFQTFRAASYLVSSGETSRPRSGSRRAATAPRRIGRVILVAIFI